MLLNSFITCSFNEKKKKKWIHFSIDWFISGCQTNIQLKVMMTINNAEKNMSNSIWL